MICGTWLASLVSSQLKSSIGHVAFIPHRQCYWNLTCCPPVPTKGASARLTTRATHCFLKAAVNCSRLLLTLGCGWAGHKEGVWAKLNPKISRNVVCESNIIRETIPALIHYSTYLLHFFCKEKTPAKAETITVLVICSHKPKFQLNLPTPNTWHP